MSKNHGLLANIEHHKTSEYLDGRWNNPDPFIFFTPKEFTVIRTSTDTICNLIFKFMTYDEQTHLVSLGMCGPWDMITDTFYLSAEAYTRYQDYKEDMIDKYYEPYAI